MGVPACAGMQLARAVIGMPSSLAGDIRRTEPAKRPSYRNCSRRRRSCCPDGIVFDHVESGRATSRTSIDALAHLGLREGRHRRSTLTPAAPKRCHLFGVPFGTQNACQDATYNPHCRLPARYRLFLAVVSAAAMFVLAHLSDPHLGPIPTPRLRELINKRGLGLINWYRKRHRHPPRRRARRDRRDMQAHRPTTSR